MLQTCVFLPHFHKSKYFFLYINCNLERAAFGLKSFLSLKSFTKSTFSIQHTRSCLIYRIKVLSPCDVVTSPCASGLYWNGKGVTLSERWWMTSVEILSRLTFFVGKWIIITVSLNKKLNFLTVSLQCWIWNVLDDLVSIWGVTEKPWHMAELFSFFFLEKFYFRKL